MNLSYFMGEKTLREKEECCYPAFSPFPPMFTKGFFLTVVTRGNCLAKGKNGC